MKSIGPQQLLPLSETYYVIVCVKKDDIINTHIPSEEGVASDCNYNYYDTSITEKLLQFKLGLLSCLELHDPDDAELGGVVGSRAIILPSSAPQE